MSPTLDLAEHYQRRTEFRDHLLRHLAPYAGAITFGFVVVKVLLVSQGNVETALNIVSSAGPLAVIGGVLVLGVPLLTTGLANAAAWLANDRGLDPFERRRLWIIFGGTLLVLSFIVTWSAILVVSLWIILPQARKSWRKWKPAPERTDAEIRLKFLTDGAPSDRASRSIWLDMIVRHNAKVDALSANPVDDAAAADAEAAFQADLTKYRHRQKEIGKTSSTTMAAAAISLTTLSLLPVLQGSLGGQPWMPAEYVQLNGEDGIVGYVVTTDSDWTYILDDKTRLVIVPKTSQIQNRTTCVTDPDNGRPPITIWKLFFGHSKAKYPDCSTVRKAHDKAA